MKSLSIGAARTADSEKLVTDMDSPILGMWVRVEGQEELIFYIASVCATISLNAEKLSFV